MSPDELARLARLELQIGYLYAHLGLDPAAAVSGGAAGAGYDAMPSAGPLPGPAGQAVPPELVSALQRGKLIEAIKIYRSMTGAGLAEAKAAVEGMAGRYR